jgi:UDP-2-acetamido-3-amino-2,3-dideoxy-glucuronate N-acetyltransferase
MTKIESTAIVEDGAEIGENCYIGHFTLIRKGAIIGNHTQIRSHCYIGENTSIGNYVLIRPFSDICLGTIIEDKVFIGMNCITTNTRKIAYLRSYKDKCEAPKFCYASRIGARVTILPGVIIGENSLIGAGSVLTKNAKPRGVYIGVPAVYIKNVEKDEII